MHFSISKTELFGPVSAELLQFKSGKLFLGHPVDDYEI